MLIINLCSFRASDGNGDGILSEKEFLSFSHPEEDPSMFDVVLQQALKQRDIDGQETFNCVIVPLN